MAATGALAEEYSKDDGDWTMRANETSGGCFLKYRNDNGNAVRLRIHTNEDQVTFWEK